MDAIELEGGEKLKVAVNSEPTLGKSGSAKITITLDYMVVTSGRGAVSTPINPTVFQNSFLRGNGTFYMTSMPTKTSEGTFLTGKHERWARKTEGGNTKHQEKLKNEGIQYYKTEVDYNYTVTNGTTLDAALLWMNSDLQGRGIIMEPLAKSDYKTSDDFRLNQANLDASKKFVNPSSGGYGVNEDYAGWDYNLIILNPRTTMTMSVTERSVHEAGHNSAAPHFHTKSGTGNYEYDQPGLQSNQPGSVYPTRQNTKNIINDKTNRQTLSK